LTPEKSEISNPSNNTDSTSSNIYKQENENFKRQIEELTKLNMELQKTLIQEVKGT